MDLIATLPTLKSPNCPGFGYLLVLVSPGATSPVPPARSRVISSSDWAIGILGAPFEMVAPGAEAVIIRFDYIRTELSALPCATHIGLHLTTVIC